MAKPMTYAYDMAQPVAAVYQTIVATQQAYFHARNAGIHELTVGTQVATTLHTKTNAVPVPATITVTAMVPNQTFTTVTKYGEGTITATYALTPSAQGTKVTYSEVNTFTKKNFATSFWVVGWLYTLLYRRNIKKRMQWIEQTAARENKVGESDDAASH